MEKTWNSIENYVTAVDKYELLSAVGWTVFITVALRAGDPCVHVHVRMVHHEG